MATIALVDSATNIHTVPVLNGEQATLIQWMAEGMGYAWGRNDEAGRTVLGSADFALTWLRYCQSTRGKSRMTIQDAWNELVRTGALDYS